MNRAFLSALLAVVVAAFPLRRIAVDQYWWWRNRIWTKGWDDAWECAQAHMKAYEDTPERYVAEHGYWWRDESGAPA